MVRNAVVDSGSSIGAQNCSVNKPCEHLEGERSRPRKERAQGWGGAGLAWSGAQGGR